MPKSWGLPQLGPCNKDPSLFFLFFFLAPEFREYRGLHGEKCSGRLNREAGPTVREEEETEERKMIREHV